MRITIIVIGALAVATLIPAWKPHWLSGHKPATDAAQSDDAQPIGIKVNADTIADLRVVEWDDASNSAKLIEVRRDGMAWSIKSHLDYPADANTRVSTAAATFLGLPRGRLVTNDPKQFADLGVIDPLDEDLTQRVGRGKRVTMVDVTGKTVADLILGKRDESGDGIYYIREKDSNNVYTVKVNPDLSTHFTDYVEVDPLKIKRDQITDLDVADYSVDLKNNQVLPRAETQLHHLLGDSWNTDSPVPPDKRLSVPTINGILTAATAIKLTDVREFSHNQMDMMAKGFYFVQPGTVDRTSPIVRMSDGDRAIIGNEGRLDITTHDGLRYSMLFGDIATSDEAKGKDAKPAADGSPDKKDDVSHDRYCVVLVAYDPSKDLDAKEAAEKAAKSEKPEPPKMSGAERAKHEQERFLKYFYVISDESFKQLRPALDKLFEAKPPEPKVGSSGKTVPEWMADNGKKAGVITTADGLQYEILQPAKQDGRGPLPTDSVEMRYRGTLAADGSEFDATKGAETRTFGVTGVIAGWTEMLQQMREGEKVRVYIKPELGYGESGQPPKIPPNSVLIFEMEMVKVVGMGIAPPGHPAPAPAPVQLHAAAPVPAPAAPPAAPAK